MALGKGYHWCPHCEKKEVFYYGNFKLNKGYNFKCRLCNRKFKKDQL